MDDNPYKPTVCLQHPADVLHSGSPTRRFVCWVFVILMPIGTLYMAALTAVCLYLLFVPAAGWAVDEVLFNVLFTLSGAAMCGIVFMKSVSTLRSTPFFAESPETHANLFSSDDFRSGEPDR